MAFVQRVGRWTLAQLRQTDGIIPGQLGTNKFDSQRGMRGMGTVRNTTTKIKADAIAVGATVITRSESLIRLFPKTLCGDRRPRCAPSRVAIGTRRRRA